MEELINDSFLKKGRYIWSKRLIEALLKMLKNVKNLKTHGGSERSFIEFFLELDMAYKQFLQEIKDLPIIMNCRTKGNNKSHFGGQQCAKLASKFRQAAEKYLNLSSGNVNESSIGYIATLIREKARRDEMYARDFETQAANNYLTSGIDNTLDILKESDYNI